MTWLRMSIEYRLSAYKSITSYNLFPFNHMQRLMLTIPSDLLSFWLPAWIHSQPLDTRIVLSLESAAVPNCFCPYFTLYSIATVIKGPIVTRWSDSQEIGDENNEELKKLCAAFVSKLILRMVKYTLLHY